MSLFSWLALCSLALVAAASAWFIWSIYGPKPDEDEERRVAEANGIDLDS